MNSDLVIGCVLIAIPFVLASLVAASQIGWKGVAASWIATILLIVLVASGALRLKDGFTELGASLVVPKPLTQEQARPPCLEQESAAESPYGPSQASWEAIIENQEAMLRALQAQIIAEQETQRLLLHFSGSHGQEMDK